MKDIVIIGAGGFGREVVELIDDINLRNPTWNIIGFVDDNPKMQKKKCIWTKSYWRYQMVGRTRVLCS